MNDDQKIFSELEIICQQQKSEIERLNLLLWDTEEENRVWTRKIEKQQKELEEKLQRIDELEKWCGHLQGIIDKDLRIIFKRAVVKVGRKVVKIFGKLGD